LAKAIALRLGAESASANPVLGKASANAPHRAKGSKRRCPFVILFGCDAIPVIRILYLLGATLAKALTTLTQHESRFFPQIW
jgi:hypothetical protein